MPAAEDPVAAAKAVLRAELRATRRAISADPVERAARSARIWAAVVPYLDGRRNVLLFRSTPTEPDTGPWYAWCAAHDRVAYEPEVGPDRTLLVRPGDVAPSVLDAVVVPGLGFTADGRRLGQGGGYYDRFLPRLRPDCVTVAVGYAEQVRPDLPVGPHDVTVQHVVTDAS